MAHQICTREMHPAKQALALAVFVSTCYLAAALGSMFTSMSVATWYPALAKPDWTPSGQVIGTVWTILYAFMGLSAWLVWRRGRFTFISKESFWFLVQLVLNVTWSAVFFGMRSPGLAVVNIGILLAAILVTTIVFSRVSLPAGCLLVPYLGWVSFASVLNIVIWGMNP